MTVTFVNYSTHCHALLTRRRRRRHTHRYVAMPKIPLISSRKRTEISEQAGNPGYYHQSPVHHHRCRRSPSSFILVSRGIYASRRMTTLAKRSAWIQGVSVKMSSLYIPTLCRWAQLDLARYWLCSLCRCTNQVNRSCLAHKLISSFARVPPILRKNTTCLAGSWFSSNASNLADVL